VNRFAAGIRSTPTISASINPLRRFGIETRVALQWPQACGKFDETVP
jgi:hypothetical protein